MTYYQAAREAALTLAVAAGGSLLFRALQLPAPWLTGSMIAVTLLAFARVPVGLPGSVRSVVFLLTGVSLGSSFTPEAMSNMLRWPVSLASLAVTVVLVMVACVAFLIVHAKWDRATAFFAVVPGALSSVLIMAMRSKADTRLVMLAQSFRVFVLMAVLPLVAGSTLSAQAAAFTSAVSSYSAIAAEITAGALLAYALEKLRFPAGVFIGGMAGSAILHVSGVLSGQMAPAILIPCQIVLGAFIGGRFRDTDPTLIRQALQPSAGAFVIALVICSLGAIAVAWASHLPAGMVLVAFAPGGLEAMCVLAFVLGLDPAFVGAHQFARFIGITLFLPVVAKLYIGDAEQ